MHAPERSLPATHAARLILVLSLTPTIGLGLGLTLAQHLAREHGGEILYQPRAGGGSNFTLRVPLAASNSPRPSLESQLS